MDISNNQMPTSALQNQNPSSYYHFSSQELRVLRECNTESFFQRSVPLGSACGAIVYLAMKNGFIRPSIKYGIAPKVGAGVLLGYFIGKFSYQEKCAQKLMQLPNSRVGEILRQRKNGTVRERIAAEQNLSIGMALAPFNQPNADIYTDDSLSQNPNSALNLDLDRPMLNDSNDIYSPLNSNTDITEPDLGIKAPSPGITYEELRKKNREDYYKQPQSQQQQSITTKPVSTSGYVEKGNDIQINKYGDIWTE